MTAKCRAQSTIMFLNTDGKKKYKCVLCILYLCIYIVHIRKWKRQTKEARKSESVEIKDCRESHKKSSTELKLKVQIASGNWTSKKGGGKKWCTQWDCSKHPGFELKIILCLINIILEAATSKSWYGCFSLVQSLTRCDIHQSHNVLWLSLVIHC